MLYTQNNQQTPWGAIDLRPTTRPGIAPIETHVMANRRKRSHMKPGWRSWTAHLRSGVIQLTHRVQHKNDWRARSGLRTTDTYWSSLLMSLVVLRSSGGHTVDQQTLLPLDRYMTFQAM